MAKSDQKKLENSEPAFVTLEDFRLLTQQIMQLAMRGLLRTDFLQEFSRILLEFSGCDAVEMWLRERGRYHRGEVNRFPKSSFYFEIMPVDKKDGEVLPDSDEKYGLIKICWDIILQRTAPFSQYMTPNGSFVTGDLTSVLSMAPKNYGPDQSGRFMPAVDIGSLAIIPVFIKHENVGLLLLKAQSSDYFSQKDVELYESIVQSLGMALIHRRTQVQLRERIKELTCLYRIAKLVENSGLSLSEILQGIVDLLPPAWLYPEVASARIVLDEETHLTTCFQEGIHRQGADIIIEGEKRGAVEVTYSQPKPELDEGPFLSEERSLIDTIAGEIALIVERKQTEEEKTRLQEQLRHADRLATIGQLSAGVAHELNEPIGSILGFAQLIEKYPELPEQVMQDTAKIKKASLHAREVIKKLMLFARQMPPQKVNLDMNQIVDEGLYFLESRCVKEGIKVERKLCKDLPAIHADPAQMNQVLVNIVVNAIQSMPEGGTLTIQTKAVKDNVVLIIADTGVGMEEKAKKQIFLPFFTTKDIGEGTGLGLAVVHGIVTSHGGSIEFESGIGRGTKFEISLPIAGRPDDWDEKNE